MEHNPTDLREQHEERAKQAEAGRLKRLEAIEDFKWLVEHPEGRRILWRLFEQANLFSTTFRANGKEQDFREGARNLLLPWWADLMEIAPERYLQMVKEHRR